MEFDICGYHNALFAQLSIPLPDVLASAVVQRRADYLSGRYAARQLLMNAGCRDAVAVGPDRAPIWPAGWCSSISHTGKWAIAVLITFSAKESLFKALFPQVQNMFGFGAAWLCELNQQQATFTLQLTQRLAPTLPAGYHVRGHYLLRDSEVITLILAPAAH